MTSLRDRTLAVAALQLPLGSADESENIAAVAALVEQAAGQGAQVILPPELFSGPYFCKQENEALFDLARPVTEHPSVLAMRGLAAKLHVANPFQRRCVTGGRLSSHCYHRPPDF